MIIIPIDTSISSHIKMSVNLGEFVCDFRLLWNERDAAWYCDFHTDNGAADGVKLVKDSPLMGSRALLGYDGDFRVIGNMQVADEEISYENLGKGFNLVFGTSDEWEEFDGIRSGV